MFFELINSLKALVLFLLLNQIIEGLFVSVGYYPNYRDYGINSVECGLTYVPQVMTITRNSNCFNKSAGAVNITIPSFLSEQGASNRSNLESIQGRVRYGVDAELGEAPWTVFLGSPVGSHLYACTGILIALDWVLTSAHCLEFLGDFIFINAGSNKLKGEITIKVNSSRNIKHPNIVDNSSWYMAYDIALISLDKPFPRMETIGGTGYLINTICLPNKNQYNLGEENATFFGFGLVNDSLRLADILQKGQANLIPHNCTILDQVICARTTNRSSSCDSDSGGPLLQYSSYERRAILIGVTRGSGPSNRTCLTTEITFWVSVSLHIDWILETISSKDSFN